MYLYFKTVHKNIERCAGDKWKWIYLDWKDRQPNPFLKLIFKCWLLTVFYIALFSRSLFVVLCANNAIFSFFMLFFCHLYSTVGFTILQMEIWCDTKFFAKFSESFLCHDHEIINKFSITLKYRKVCRWRASIMNNLII